MSKFGFWRGVVVVVGIFSLVQVGSAFPAFLSVAKASGIVKVQSVALAASSGNSLALAYPSANTAGNLLVVVAETDDSSTFTITDSLANTYTRAKNTTWDYGLRDLSVYYAVSSASGANTVTLKSSTTGGGKQLQIFEYSGLVGSAVLDQVSSSNAIACSGTCINSPSVTTTQASELLFAAGGPAANTLPAPKPGYTIETKTNLGGSSAYIVSEDQVVSGAGAYQAGLNFTSQASAGIIFVTFKGGISGPDTTAPTIPTNLVATSTSSSQINLTWSASTDPDSAVAGYQVFRNGVQIATSSLASYSDTGLTPSTNYNYTVTAFDPSGNVSAQSVTVSMTTQAVPPPDTTPPSIPANLSASAVSSSQINLSWTASTDPDSPVSGYLIYRGGQQIATSTTVGYTDTNVVPATNYSYTVAAFDPSGNVSAQSSSASATTQASNGTTAGTWNLKRFGLPPGTPVSGMYSPSNAVPGGTDFQNLMFYNPVDRSVCAMQPDTFYGGGEWGNAMFCYSVNADDGSSQTGSGTGWNLLWDSLNTQLNNNSGLGGPSEITGMSCSAGTVTITTAFNSAQYLRPTNSWVLTKAMPTGFTNGMFQVTPKGSTTGPFNNLYSSFTYNDPACVNGTGTAGAGTIIVNPDEYTDMPMRRHAEGMAFDTNRNAMWLSTGVGDADADANIINSEHSGFADLYEMTKTANGGANWKWSQICGFGGNSPGLTLSQLPSIGPGSPCGQEFLTTTTSGPQVSGIPCLDIPGGGISSGGNGGSCGYKFPYAGFDATNDVFIVFGGQWNSGYRCETLLYYPATNTWKNATNTNSNNSGCGTTYPDARWNTAGSRLVSMGNGKMLLFGGSGNSSFNDTWIFQTCAQNNLSACGWTRVNSTVSPGANPNPVIDWAPNLGKVVLVDYQTPAHYWFFDPTTLQWADQGTGSGSKLPSLTSQINCTSGTGQNCGSPSYWAIGAYDASAQKMVILNGCSITSNPPCSTSYTSTQIWSLDLSSGGGTLDTTAPTTPTNLTATSTSSSQINLSWFASSDNVAVAGYKIFRNGSQIATSTINSYLDTGLTASTNYSYTVAAFDAAGNVSVQSVSASATTASVVNSDITPPLVNLAASDSNNQAIIAGNTVDGFITITATANDPTVANQTTSGLASLSLSLDGTIVASSTTGSLSYSFNTTSLFNSSHSFTATANDNAGNVAVSAPFKLQEIGFQAD